MARISGSVVGILCLAIGWAGFELLGWSVVRRRDLGHEILTGDGGVLVFMGIVAALSTLLFANGIVRLRRGLRAWRQWRAEARAAAGGTALPPPPSRDVEWQRRRIVFGTPVRTSIVILAYIFFGGPALFFIIVFLVKEPVFVFAALPLSGILLFIVGAVTYWWLRRLRYGDSVCWVRTLPGIAGGRFEADVDCALPEGAEPVIVRLKNLVPAGKRVVEIWRMEESLAVPAGPGRTVVEVRLSLPQAKEQRFMPLEPRFKEWLFGGALWILEVEKRVPGIDFLARFSVKVADLTQRPPVAVVAPPPDFGLPARPAAAPLAVRVVAALKQAAPALALSLAFGAAWLGYRDGWLRTLRGPSAQWLEQESFQREMNFWSRHRNYPALIEMRCEGNVALYRSDWKPLPERGYYRAWSAMTRQDYERRSREYARDGFALETTGRFRNCAGEERISATWLKRL